MFDMLDFRYKVAISVQYMPEIPVKQSKQYYYSEATMCKRFSSL